MTTRTPYSDPIAAVSLIIGGLLFIPAGVTHPAADEGGTALEQLHTMVTADTWMLSSVLMAVSLLGFAVAFVRLRRQVTTGAPATAVRWGSVIAVIAVLGGVLYLFGPMGADGLIDGGFSWFAVVMFATHLVVNPAWGVAVAAIALWGGLSRTVGHPLTAVLGVAGGLAWTVAMLAAPYIETLDETLFPFAGTAVTLWAVVVGAMGLRRRRTAPEPVLT